jgi:hypothetical protein
MIICCAKLPHLSNTTLLPNISSEIFIERSIATLINNSCNIRNQRWQHQKNMYTNNSDIRFDDENSHRNIDTIFRATSTMKYKKIIITILVLVSCNICRASDRWTEIRRLIRSLTVSNKSPVSKNRKHLASGCAVTQL